jgi:hypothetical protein
VFKNKKDEEPASIHETSEEETGEEEEVEETDSEYGNESAQPLIKPTKTVKRKVSKEDSLKSSSRKETPTSASTSASTSLSTSASGQVQRKRKGLDVDDKDITKKKTKSEKESKNVDGQKYEKFTNSDCDSDYTGDSTKDLVYHKVKIAPSVNMICHVFDGSKVKNYQGSEFAAITIQKKTKEDKCYELTIPIDRGYNMIRCIDKFAELNPDFFKNISRPPCPKCKK